jgi:hypothetical protein
MRRPNDFPAATKPVQASKVKIAGMPLLKKLLRFMLPVIGIVVLTTGCKTYQDKNKVIVYWRQGNLPKAAAEATKEAYDNAKNKDAIIWRLEEGAVLRAEGKFDDSNKAFGLAQDKIDSYELKAKVRLGQETGALLSNQANLDYEGRSYDGIMMNTYRALNYLALGEPDKARPELIRAYQRQQDAVQQNQKRIEKTREEAAKDKRKALYDKAEKNPKFQSQIQNSMTNLNGVKVYADYVNPFTVYLDGLYFMTEATGYSDLERARKSFERVASFVGYDEYAKQDMAMVENAIHGQPLPPTTYVIFETGCAPIRDQIRIDIPIIVYNVSYVGAAFPKLVPQGDFLPTLNVAANGANYQTTTVADMDSMIALDFRNELPVVILKTLASTITKATASYFANDAANQQGDLVGFLSQLATAAYQMAVNIADTRTWTTLPKQFQICRFPTPPDGKIELLAPNSMQVVVALTGAGGVKNDLTSTNGVQTSLNNVSVINVVYVKSITAQTPLLVSQFKLK